MQASVNPPYHVNHLVRLFGFGAFVGNIAAHIPQLYESRNGNWSKPCRPQPAQCACRTGQRYQNRINAETGTANLSHGEHASLR